MGEQALRPDNGSRRSLENYTPPFMVHLGWSIRCCTSQQKQNDNALGSSDAYELIYAKNRDPAVGSSRGGLR